MPEFQGPTGEPPELRKLKTVTSRQLLTMEFPPRKNLLDPWLPQQGLVMVFAKRGVGKTHVGLGIAYAVASGGRFLGWQAPEPAGVLYVDGEMPARALKERLAAIACASDAHPPRPEMLRIITPDLQPHDIPSLTTYEGGMALAEHMGGASLIVLDNLSTLCLETRENETESWMQVQAWCLKLRRLGKSVLFVHHAGRGGEQRGTSRREDVLDTMIELRHPHDYHPSEGARFEVHFTKARGLMGSVLNPFEARLDTSDGSARWNVSDLDNTLADRMDALIEDGFSVREIASMVGLSKSAVHRYKQMEEGRRLLLPPGAAPRPSVPEPSSPGAGQGAAQPCMAANAPTLTLPHLSAEEGIRTDTPRAPSLAPGRVGEGVVPTPSQIPPPGGGGLGWGQSADATVS
ncbi:MAG: AAA family ATPase [Proteobacteria bacterium]|nr:AAA family ATPase [Pseudomonadota bacterium]